MQKYELAIVLDGKVTSAKKKKMVETIEKMVSGVKGKVGKVEDWGEKELMGKIGKSTTGNYIFFPLELDTKEVLGLEAKLKVEKDILRHLLIRK